MLLAEKHYREHTNPQNICCCRCMRYGARYYAAEGYDFEKADDCRDSDHSETCWLCKRCLREIGAEW